MFLYIETSAANVKPSINNIPRYILYIIRSTYDHHLVIQSIELYARNINRFPSALRYVIISFYNIIDVGSRFNFTRF